MIRSASRRPQKSTPQPLAQPHQSRSDPAQMIRNPQRLEVIRERFHALRMSVAYAL